MSERGVMVRASEDIVETAEWAEQRNGRSAATWDFDAPHGDHGCGTAAAVIDRNGCIVETNASWRTLLAPFLPGQEPRQLRGAPYARLLRQMVPEDAFTALELDARTADVCEASEVAMRVTVPLNDRDTDTVHLIECTHLNGAGMGALVVHHDLTYRDAQGPGAYQHGADGPVPTCVCQSGRIVWANGAFARVAGARSADTLAGAAVSRFVAPWPEARSWHDAATGAPTRLEGTIASSDGARYAAAIDVLPLTLGGVPAFQIVLTASRAADGRPAGTLGPCGATDVRAHLLDEVLDAVAAIDIDNRFLYVNRAAEWLYRMPREQLLGRHFRDAIDLRTLGEAGAGAARRTVLETGRWRGEHMLVRPDGDERFVESSLKLLRNVLGEPVAVLAVVRDVTERKRAEQAQHENTRYLRHIAANLPGIIFQLERDSDGRFRFLFIGGGVAEEFGIPEGILSRDASVVFGRIHPRDRRAFVATLSASVRTSEPWHWEGRFVGREGAQWLQVDAVPTPREDGSIVWDGLVLDVTDRKHAEHALIGSERRYRGLLENASDAIVVIQGDTGLIENVNRQTERLSGYSAAELIGRPFHVLHPAAENDLYRRGFERSLARQNTYIDDIVLVARDGRHIPVSISTSVVEVDGESLVEAFIRDESHRKAYERAVVNAHSRAEEAMRLKANILANMSHEIRTPLTTVIGFSEILMEELSEEHRELLAHIRESGKRLDQTLTSLLDMASIESDRFTVRKEWLDVGVEVADVLAQYEVLAAGKGLALRSQLPIDPVNAELDRGLLHRIVANLVDNAIKFTKEGYVEVGLVEEGGEATMVVSDTGPGIDTGFALRMFDEFSQESSGLARTHEGAGLGLAVVKRLVELHDGRIVVESVPGVGSTFTVSLPLSGDGDQR